MNWSDVSNGNEGTKRDAVFTAVRQADHRYDGAAPDSQGMTRPEYVGRAALAALNAETTDRPVTSAKPSYRT